MRRQRHPWHQWLVIANIRVRGWLRRMALVARGGKPFCDFCDCPTCLNGEHGITHAPTADGRWICDVCWQYDVCDVHDGKYNGPCESDEGEPIADCPHRPKLIGMFDRRK